MLAKQNNFARCTNSHFPKEMKELSEIRAQSSADVQINLDLMERVSETRYRCTLLEREYADVVAEVHLLERTCNHLETHFSVLKVRNSFMAYIAQTPSWLLLIGCDVIGRSCDGKVDRMFGHVSNDARKRHVQRYRVEPGDARKKTTSCQFDAFDVCEFDSESSR